MSLAEILDAVQQWPPMVIYLALFLGSLVEYIFPPVPGDTIVVAGAVLVGAFGWDVWPVYLVVTAGATIGATADFYLGRWLVRTGRIERLGAGPRRAIRDLVERFERRGAWYLAINRFLPGIRAFFFVAAGLAGLRLRAVLFWSTLSALAWNALLIAAGVVLGQQLDTLEQWLTRYQSVMWSLIGLIITGLVYRLWRAGKADARDEKPHEPDAF